MQLGASTASFYPMETEQALRFLAENGVKDIEIFVNCECEIKSPIREEIAAIIKEYDLNIISVHPLPTYESLYIFSGYERRLTYGFQMYGEYFEAARLWGARYLVLHGVNKDAHCPFERYVERFKQLYDLGISFDVTLLQENVFYCKSGNLKFLRDISTALGDSVSFVLDLKQAVRAGYSPFDVVNAVGEKIVHVHLSDNGPCGDCLPIGKGCFDFTTLFDKLPAANSAVIELYREDYGEHIEIVESVKNIEKVLGI